jgi:hypothetical protein
VSVYANKASAFAFLMQASFFVSRPLVSQSRKNPPSPSGLKTISVFLRFAADKVQKEMQDAVVRMRPGLP